MEYNLTNSQTWTNDEESTLSENNQLDSRIYWTWVEKHCHIYGDLYTSYLVSYHAEESNLKLTEELHKLCCKKIENEGEIFLIDDHRKWKLSIKLILNLSRRQVKEFRLMLPPKEELNSFKPFSRTFGRIAERVTDMIQIKRYKISRKLFPRIVSSWGHISNLILYECQIETGKIKFGEKVRYKLDTLNLAKWGMKEYSNWKANPKGLNSIFRAISNWTLKHSLQTIFVHMSGLEKDMIAQMIHENGLQNITVKGSVSSFYSVFEI